MSGAALPICHICGGNLTELDNFAELERVTSDCRPWPAGGQLAVCETCDAVQKPLTETWQSEANAIYGGYVSYHQSSGKEQMVFGAGGGQPRSTQLLSKAFEIINPPERGRMLDVGCGIGGLLRSFGEIKPGWTLAGTELSDGNRAVITQIPGVEGFYVGEIETVPGQFDIVTMMHSLEHIPNPSAFLRRLGQKLRPGGSLIIEVPDLDQNPFDLVIADHCSHFREPTLRQVVSSAGFTITALAHDWIAKELSVIACHGESRAPALPKSSGLGCAGASIAWLMRLTDEAHRLSRNGPIGVFGTSIAATWLCNRLSSDIAFFVDEDPERIDRLFMGRPVMSPAQVAKNATVFVPLAPTVARQVALRLGGAPRYIAAPNSTPP